MTTYGTLKSDVQSAMGRSDIPSFVYTLVQSDLNRDLRILEMQSESTLVTSTESVALPSDFLQISSAYIDSGGTRTPLIPDTETSAATLHDPSGRPYTYAIHDGELTLNPVPDGEYTISYRYYAKPAAFSADSDTNDVMASHYGLYFYGALTHAAIWAKDDASAQTYNAAYATQLDRVKKADIKRRIGGGPLVQNAARGR